MLNLIALSLYASLLYKMLKGLNGQAIYQSHTYGIGRCPYFLIYFKPNADSACGSLPQYWDDL